MKGELAVILDGAVYMMGEGEHIHIPAGTAHCMANMHGHPAFIREVQKGICREGDNIRLMDCNGRPTYPCSTEREYRSVLLYEQLQEEMATGVLSSRALFQAAGR